ncbi:MAG: site-specific integrase [Mesorhizobium sp.]|nr:site-specific integrase [Mesorhizobium sp. M8A.F.Ca.ET.023.01.1.1]RWC78345.1 MAG: site-specific integrase [Mesorhizobium sp.]
MTLSDTSIRALKAQGTPKKYSDGGGLYLFVPPNGSRLWRLAYGFGGKQKTLALGIYPAVGLAAARRARDEAKALLAAGTDPGRQKKLDRIKSAEAAGNTFASIAADLRAAQIAKGRAEGTMDRFDYLVEFASADLGKLPITEISAAEVLEVLGKMERRNAAASAVKLRMTIGQVFRHAIATARAKDDPTIALRGALVNRPAVNRPAIQDRKAFGGLLRAVWGYDGTPEAANGLKLLAYLYPRPGELRLAEWKEFDLDAATWTIPAARTKMRREHRKPLPKQAVEILREQRENTGDGVLVFPSIRSRKRPISDMTWGAALRRVGIEQDEHCPHGFRASASTILNEAGRWSADAIERELAHIEKDKIRRAYNRAGHWDERVAMATWWADLIDGLRKGAAVVSMTAA